MLFTLALAYSGREEIMRAAQALAASAPAANAPRRNGNGPSAAAFTIQTSRIRI